MYIYSAKQYPMSLAEAVAPVQELTQLDVMSPRIDVFAQKALFRMLKSDPESNLIARSMIYAVKLKDLAGFYKENQQAPALRAQKLGKGWWQLIPKGKDAVCLKEPTNLKPMIVFRDSIRSIPSRLDPALKEAWVACTLAVPSPPPYRPKAFPKAKPGLPAYPPPAERPCDEAAQEARFFECDNQFNNCKDIADNFRFKEMLECGSDQACRNNAYSSFKKRQARCATGLIVCQEKARC